MSDPNSGVSGTEGGEVRCPVCAANTEAVDGGGLDCGAAFDPTGGRVNVE